MRGVPGRVLTVELSIYKYINIGGIYIEEELWRDVVDYEGYYQVSSLGNVRSLTRVIRMPDGTEHTRAGKAMAKIPNSDGYYHVKLSRDGNTKTASIHRLVAEAFIPNPDGLPEVNHIDFNRKNNAVNNLEWVKHSENVHKSIDAGRHICTTDLTGDNNPNYGNRTLSKRYADDPLFALEKQSRPRSQNGRAVAISMTDGITTWRFPCMMDCADYLIQRGATNARPTSITSHLWYAMKNNSKYLGYTFERV